MSAGEVFAGLSEACMVASGGCVWAGWRRIRQGRVHAHRRLMVTAAVLGGAFFVLYATHTVLFGDSSFGGPLRWRAPYLAFLQVHSILATLAGVMGVFTLRLALRRRFRAHRRLAPWTATGWLIAAVSGLTVFVLLYVVFRPGPAHGILQTILGHPGL